MTRSPFAYGLSRGADSDGGAADLQTDVMRFMAILSLCLVAIFALVQSIPPTAPALPPDLTEAPAPVAAAEPAPVSEPEPPQPVAAARPEPRPVAVPEPIRLRPEDRPPPPAPREPAAQAVTRAAEPPPAPPPAAEPSKGFTLSFESDHALGRLVARHEIGLYAILAGGNALRMSMDGGQPSFWKASTPAQYHEMDAATVPPEVSAALKRSGARPGDGVVWGVTLPAQMSRDLDRYLREYEGGALVISADGRLRREG